MTGILQAVLGVHPGRPSWAADTPGGGYGTYWNTNAAGTGIYLSGDTETRPKNVAVTYCIKY
jgi:hypothetical protein